MGIRGACNLVEEALAGDCAAKTRYAVIATNLALELVVVGQLLVCLLLAYQPTVVSYLGNLLIAISLNA